LAVLVYIEPASGGMTFYINGGVAMLYLVTHAHRESAPNPSHTNKGLIEIASGIMLGTMIAIRRFCGASVVYVGFGKRFRETYHALKPALEGLEMKHSLIFGSECSKKDRKGGRSSIIVSGQGKKIREDKYLGLADIPGFDCWGAIMRKLPDGAIIITGREFMRCFLKSRNCSIYEANTARKLITPIVESGAKNEDHWLFPKKLDMPGK